MKQAILIIKIVLAALSAYSFQLRANEPIHVQAYFAHAYETSVVQASARQTLVTPEQNYQNHLRQQAAKTHVLLQYCLQNGIDPSWATPAAQNVMTRCTAINFLNGCVGSTQRIYPSALPEDFVEDFGAGIFNELLNI